MIQIAIWGIAFMLIVKGLDVLHRQRIARNGQDGAPILTWVILGLAVFFALILFASSGQQASSVPTPPTFNP